MLTLAGVTVHNYHSDDGVGVSSDFMQSFSDIGAQDQNVHVEQDTQTLRYWARTMMVNCAFHWPSDDADKLTLRSFAMEHTTWLYNWLPNCVFLASSL